MTLCIGWMNIQLQYWDGPVTPPSPLNRYDHFGLRRKWQRGSPAMRGKCGKLLMPVMLRVSGAKQWAMTKVILRVGSSFCCCCCGRRLLILFLGYGDTIVVAAATAALFDWLLMLLLLWLLVITCWFFAMAAIVTVVAVIVMSHDYDCCWSLFVLVLLGLSFGCACVLGAGWWWCVVVQFLEGFNASYVANMIESAKVHQNVNLTQHFLEKKHNKSETRNPSKALKHLSALQACPSVTKNQKSHK